MYPWQLLVLVLMITAGALAAQLRARTRRARRLRDLASRERMHYSSVDRFGLAPRVAKYFPSPGVADVRVADLLYRSDDGGHRYVFTVDYTRGVLGVKRRVRGVALMTEPKPKPGQEVPPTIKMGNGAASVLAQYETLVRTA